MPTSLLISIRRALAASCRCALESSRVAFLAAAHCIARAVVVLVLRPHSRQPASMPSSRKAFSWAARIEGEAAAESSPSFSASARACSSDSRRSGSTSSRSVSPRARSAVSCDLTIASDGGVASSGRSVARMADRSSGSGASAAAATTAASVSRSCRPTWSRSMASIGVGSFSGVVAPMRSSSQRKPSISFTPPARCIPPRLAIKSPLPQPTEWRCGTSRGFLARARSRGSSAIANRRTVSSWRAAQVAAVAP